MLCRQSTHVHDDADGGGEQQLFFCKINNNWIQPSVMQTEEIGKEPHIVCTGEELPLVPNQKEIKRGINRSSPQNSSQGMRMENVKWHNEIMVVVIHDLSLGFSFIQNYPK